MNIAIDFDETITRDAKLFGDFCSSAEKLGHKIYIVTCRRDTVENEDLVRSWLKANQFEQRVIFTSPGSKLDAMKRRNIPIDIWIDDDPSCIIHGK